MGIIDRLKWVFTSTDDSVPDENKKSKSYPVYHHDFFYNITWKCRNCENEIYWMENDDCLTCHICNTKYSVMENDFPELLRAKCWNCGEISDKIRGERSMNFSYNCPNCDFWWKSHQW